MGKNILIVVNAAPYGSERALSALRIALTLSQRDEKSVVRLFFMSDGVGVAVANQQTAEKQTLEIMLKEIAANGAQVLLCKTCVAARGLEGVRWVDGVGIGTLNDLADWTLSADTTLCF